MSEAVSDALLQALLLGENKNYKNKGFYGRHGKEARLNESDYFELADGSKKKIKDVNAGKRY